MKVYYKTTIDYDKTLRQMSVGEEVEVKTSDQDVQNVRNSGSKIRKRNAIPGEFTVHRTISGALIRRIA